MSLFKMPALGMDVGERLDFYIDMTAELSDRNSGPVDDQIDTVVWTLPSEFDLISQFDDGSIAQVVIAANTPVEGSTYIIKATITTTYPRIYVRSFKIPVKER